MPPADLIRIPTPTGLPVFHYTAAQMKLKTEQSEMKELTFQPEIRASTKQYKDVQGKLRILTEPESYLQRLQKEAQSFSDKQRRAMQQVLHPLLECALLYFDASVSLTLTHRCGRFRRSCVSSRIAPFGRRSTTRRHTSSGSRIV